MPLYRDVNQQEIDLILQKNPHSPAVAVEIKSSKSAEIPARHIIRRFSELLPGSHALVISGADKAYSHNGLDFFPIEEGITRALELAAGYSHH